MSRALCAITLVFSLVIAVPSTAYATVLGEDVVGNATVTDRGLTISQTPDVDASFAMLMTSTGEVLWSRHATDTASIASVTKIMTAVVALESADLSTMITIPPEAATIGESSANLMEGTQVSLGNLLYGLMIPSGNDAAISIAIGIAGSEDAFVAMMNAKATELGMTNTFFENPHGLDEGDHQSCAADIALLAEYAMKKDAFRSIVSKPTATVDLGYGETTLTSTNALLTTYDGAIGIKTGFTDPAGYCVASAASRNGVELYAIVLGASNASARFTSAATLLDWGFAHYTSVNLSDPSVTVAEVPSLDWIDKAVPVAAQEADTAWVLDYNGPVSQYISVIDIYGDVDAGDVLGTITWTQGGIVVGTSPLIATEDCEEPGVFDSIVIWFKRTFTAVEDHAELKVLVDPVTIQTPFPESLDAAA
ncbi:MAG: D-alanyl-D-alanine carboxypeptidase [Actinobacteria bacterium]|nr:D-alanyl-D-alanine carboxypeptidase [Actinomycetota bacterium]